MVADEYPWPSRSGYRQRLHWMLTTLAGQGSVDFLAVVLHENSATEPPPVDLSLSRLVVVPAGPRTESRMWRLARWLIGRKPRALLWRDWGPARATLQTWSDEPYDLVWFSHAPAYFALVDLVCAPLVVDLDNLESSALRHRRHKLLQTSPSNWVSRIMARIGAAADAIDEVRWRRLESEITQAGASVVVCSRLDRDRLGRSDGVWVVPNGYEPATLAARTHLESRPVDPVLIMVGLLNYEPNRDAAAFFATEILPRIRLHRSDARLRIVGRYDSVSAVEPLRGIAGVDVLGEVADVASQLASADISVVPIRFGGGTRIKILEAFAHGLPVVSTTVGCEGLDVIDGEHLLVADDPVAFAAACLRLSEDAELRAKLVSAAAELWRSRYRWTALSADIVQVVQGVHGTQR